MEWPTDLEGYLSIFMRSSAFLFIAPLGTERLMFIRFGLALAVTLVASGMQIHYEPNGMFIDLAIGMILALPLRLLAEGLSLIAELLDNQRGQFQGYLYNPFSEVVTSSSSAVVSYGVTAFIVWSGIILSLPEVIRDSYLLTDGTDSATKGVLCLISTGRVGASHFVWSLLGLYAVWLSAFLCVDMLILLASWVQHGLQPSQEAYLFKLCLLYIVAGLLLGPVQHGFSPETLNRGLFTGCYVH